MTIRCFIKSFFAVALAAVLQQKRRAGVRCDEKSAYEFVKE